MFSGPAVTRWVDLGRALGLQAFEPTAGYGPGANFRQVKRTLGIPTPGKVDFTHWFYGRWRETEVTVLMFEQGSGSRSTTYSAAIARVDPPLFLGLAITPHAWIRLFETEDVRVGHFATDEALHIQGADPRRVASLLAPGDPAAWSILQRTIGLKALDGFCVSDSAVAAWKEASSANLADIPSWLDQTTALASELGARGRALLRTPRERAQEDEWQRFANANGFRFEAARMRLSAPSTQLEIALETEGDSFRTAVTIGFPRPIDVGFTARSTQLPSFLQGLFSQDIRVGDPEFDDLFCVTGYPEPYVRALLARPRLLAALKYVGARTTEVQMNHLQLFFRVPGPSPTAPHLAELAELARSAAGDLFREVAAIGPFR